MAERESWVEIERAAREQATADVIALETTPLEFGQDARDWRGSAPERRAA